MLNIGIIGGGPGGLIALYECRKRHLEATLYEKHSNIGGVWNLNSKESRAHFSTVFNTSSFLSLFSVENMSTLELEPSKDDYLTSSQYQRYLENLVKRYELNRDIHYNEEVLGINEQSGRFSVKILQLKNLEETNYIHDYIIVCTGRNGIITLPNEDFLPRDINVNKDVVWHSSLWDPLNMDSKISEIVQRKRCCILVIGGGHSAAESIQDTIESAKVNGTVDGLKIMWAPTRKPKERNVWMMNRYPYSGSKSNLPADEKQCRLYTIVPTWIISKKIREIVHPILIKKSSVLPNFITDLFCMCKRTIIKNALKEGIVAILNDPILQIRKGPLGKILFDMPNKNGIVADAIVLATGYKYADIKINDNYILQTSKFHRGIIPLDQRLHGHLGFVGTSKIIGSSLGIIQMEVRWLLYQWFSERSHWKRMFHTLQSKDNNATLEGTVCNEPRFPVVVMDSLAKDMDAMPCVWRNLFSIYPYHRRIAIANLLAPLSIHQYIDPFETRHEKLDREKYLLMKTEQSFKKANCSFKIVCRVADIIFYCGVSFVIYLVFYYFKYVFA